MFKKQSWFRRTLRRQKCHFEKRVHENQGQPKKHRHRRPHLPAVHHDGASTTGEYPFRYRQSSKAGGGLFSLSTEAAVINALCGIEHHHRRAECLAMARRSKSPNVQARWLAMAQTWSKHAGNGDDVQPSNVIRLNFDRRGTTPALPSAAVFPTAPAFRTAAALPKAFVIY